VLLYFIVRVEVIEIQIDLKKKKILFKNRYLGRIHSAA
jgi:hypothetical protein